MNATRYTEGSTVLGGCATLDVDIATCPSVDGGLVDFATGDGVISDPHVEYTCCDFVERSGHDERS